MQVYQSWWLQAAQRVAHLLQNHQQHTSASAYPAHSTEAASQSGSSQTGIVCGLLNTCQLVWSAVTRNLCQYSRTTQPSW